MNSRSILLSKMDIFVPPVKKTSIEVIKALIPNIDPTLKDNMLIQWAAEEGHLELVEELLKNRKVNPAVENNYPIRVASQRGYSEIVKLLITDNRVNPGDVNNYALCWAVRNNHVDIAKLLLQDKRTDPSDRENLAINWAAYNGSVEIVRLLLQDERVDPSIHNNNPLRDAIRNNRLEVIKLLLDCPKVDPEAGLALPKVLGEIKELLEDAIKRRNLPGLKGEPGLIIKSTGTSRDTSRVIEGELKFQINPSIPISAEILEWKTEGKELILNIKLP